MNSMTDRPLEIERKFLVNLDLLPPLPRQQSFDILQGYLSLQPTVRVRTREYDGEGRMGWITVKGPGGLVRAEYEYEIPYDHALSMLTLCLGHVSKTRYEVQVGDHLWEVDRYHGNLQGLWTAEVELKSPDEEFERPAWIGREVTEDSAYTNVMLSQGGIP